MSRVRSVPGASGRLVVVGTPIGNLEDLSARAIRTLGEADVLACEDTRRTLKLLNHEGIPATGRLVSFHEHNEASRIPELLERVREGLMVAVVSDAGMPAISDPGQRLVNAALEEGLEVSVVPGPTAAISALVLSGLDSRSFAFEGFLPRKGRLRAEVLSDISTRRATTVLYESPYRLVATLGDLAQACGGDRKLAVVREITKLHEEVWRGNAEGAFAQFSTRAGSAARLKGEYVLVVEGARASPWRTF